MPKITELKRLIIKIYSPESSRHDTKNKGKIQETKTLRPMSFQWHRFSSLALGPKGCGLGTQHYLFWKPVNSWGCQRGPWPGRWNFGLSIETYEAQGLLHVRRNVALEKCGFSPFNLLCFFPRKVMFFQHLRISLSQDKICLKCATFLKKMSLLKATASIQESEKQ